MNKTGLIYISKAFYCCIKRKNQTILMAQPQNLRFRQFQAFFGCKGKKSNKNKNKGQFFRLFLIISQTKKIENRTTFGFLWIFGAKKGKSKKIFQNFQSSIPFQGRIKHKIRTIFTAELKNPFLPSSLKKIKKNSHQPTYFFYIFLRIFFENRTTTDR